MLQRSLVKNVLCNSFVIFFGVNKKMSDNTGSSFFRTRGCYLKYQEKVMGVVFFLRNLFQVKRFSKI